MDEKHDLHFVAELEQLVVATNTSIKDKAAFGRNKLLWRDFNSFCDGVYKTQKVAGDYAHRDGQSIQGTVAKICEMAQIGMTGDDIFYSEYPAVAEGKNTRKILDMCSGDGGFIRGLNLHHNIFFAMNSDDKLEKTLPIEIKSLVTGVAPRFLNTHEPLRSALEFATSVPVVRVDLVVADGWVAPKDKENSYKLFDMWEAQRDLFLTQLLAAMLLVRDGGTILIKCCHHFTLSTIPYVISLMSYFDKVSFWKPPSSALTNYERYVSFQGYRAHGNKIGMFSEVGYRSRTFGPPQCSLTGTPLQLSPSYLVDGTRYTVDEYYCVCKNSVASIGAIPEIYNDRVLDYHARLYACQVHLVKFEKYYHLFLLEDVVFKVHRQQLMKKRMLAYSQFLIDKKRARDNGKVVKHFSK